MTSFLWRDSSSPDGINTVNEKAPEQGAFTCSGADFCPFEGSFLQKIKKVLPDPPAVLFIQELVAHAGIEDAPDIPVSQVPKEGLQTVEMLRGTDDGVLPSCNEENGKLRVTDLKAPFAAGLLRQDKEVVKPVIRKEKAAEGILPEPLHRIGITADPGAFRPELPVCRTESQPVHKGIAEAASPQEDGQACKEQGQVYAVVLRGRPAEDQLPEDMVAKIVAETICRAGRTVGFETTLKKKTA